MMIHSAPFRSLALVMALGALPEPASAQVTRTWVDPYSPPTWFRSETTDVDAVPGGGILTTSTSEGLSFPTPATALIRRLNENGDRLWEAGIPLAADDYIAFPYREYVADTAVGQGGEAAVAVGSSTGLEVLSYAADGSILWTQSVTPIDGPHFEGTCLAFTPGGNVVMATSERLFSSGDTTVRFRLFLFSGASGNVLWERSDLASGFVRLDVDATGEIRLLVDRDATGQGNWQLERFDPSGAVTGVTPIPLGGTDFRVVDMEVDASGRAVIGFARLSDSALVSVDASMALEWVTPLAPPILRDFAPMVDGHTVYITDSNFGVHGRLDAAGATVYSTSPILPQGTSLRKVLGLPNGNSAIGGARFSISTLRSTSLFEARDATGLLVRSEERELAMGDQIWFNQLALGERGNVHAAQTFDSSSSSTLSGRLSKYVFEDNQGVSYCGPSVPNSSGVSGRVMAAGSNAAPADNLTLLFSGLPVGSTLLALTSQTPGFAPSPGGSQGNLCLGGAIGRYVGPGQIRRADGGGRASLQLDLPNMPTPSGPTGVAVMPGQTWYFQGWFRDANPSITSNFTDGLAVTF